MEEKSREQFQKLLRVYAMASAINHLIARVREPQAIFYGACRIAVERGDFRLAWVGMLELDGNEKILRPVASAGISNDHLGFLKINSGPLTAAKPCAQAALSGKPQLCNNIRLNPNAGTWRDAALKRDYRSAVAFPLKIADDTVGAFVLYAARDNFEMDELHLLDEIAADISFALEYHRGEQERRRVAEELRACEERFRLLAETVEDVFWISTPAQDRVIYVSPAYERIWGRSCQSLYDKPSSWVDSIHPDDRARIRQALAKQLNGEKYAEMYRIFRPDMKIRWIQDTAFLVRNAAGQIERVVGAARDITQYCEMSEKLRHAEKTEAKKSRSRKEDSP